MALSLLAVPLFVTGFVGSGFAAAMVTGAIVMLWFQPARDWFDGISRAPAPAAPPPAPSPSPSVSRDALHDLPPPTRPPLYPTAYAAAPARPAVDSLARPPAVTWACVLTWLGSATTFVLMAALVLVLVDDPGIVHELRSENPDLADPGITDAVVRATLYALAGVAMAWSAAATALALLAWRRVGWAAWALAVSAGLAGALCLAVTVGSLAFVAPLAVCAAALALLLRPESRAWLRTGRRSG
jgi:hypothetical protein